MLHCREGKNRHAVCKVVKFTAGRGVLSVVASSLLSISLAFGGECPSPVEYDLAPTTAQQWSRLHAQQHLAAGCPQLAAELAMAHFWGGANRPASLVRSAHFAAFADVAPLPRWQLRLLRASFVLAGVQAGNMDAAIAVFQRELTADSRTRQQQAWSVLNQLAATGSLSRLASRYALHLADGGLLGSDARGSVQRIDSGEYRAVADQPPAVFYPQWGDSRLPLREWRGPRGGLRVGQLYSYYHNGHDARCTATALTSRWVITAAHCLYGPEVAAPLADMLRFYPAPAQHPGQSLGIDAVWMLDNRHRQLIAGDIAAYAGSDLALLKLDAAIPGEVVAPQLGAEDASPLLYSYAYPEDTPGGSLWLSVCGALAQPSRDQRLMGFWSLDCRSRPGQSGALLWQAGERPIGVGVLSANLTDSGGVRAIAARFSAPILADIQRIVRGEAPQAVHWRQVQR